ncbi:MAG: type II/IV secretion system protein [Verrucomicrobia bacterium]|jgi:type IV pilus assembly protein PilB|nr:type II/IV secretion system protein [Verrucomicrobiota bacterium]
MTSSSPRETFIELLVRNERITPDDATPLTSELSDLAPEQVVRILQDRKKLNEQQATQSLAEFYGYAYVDLSRVSFDKNALTKLPAQYAKDHAVIPFLLLEDELSVAVASVDFGEIDELSRLTGCNIHLHLSTTEDILRAIDLQYFSYAFKLAGQQFDTTESLEEATKSSAIVELSHSIIASAVKERASDIHIEPQEDFVRVRYRIDGILREEQRIPKDLQLALLARYKIMSTLDIAETRRPQDGRIQLKLGAFSYDLRVSVAPAAFGEKIVMRVLDKSKGLLSIDSLSLSAYNETHLTELAKAASGILFVTGPTGSGKTTTCYSILEHLNTIDRNIVTIENPIEYQLPVITQLQVQHNIGLGFADLLRSVLRQDPDIILVGEIRDLETAKIATEAALTGHLVLATLHTNNAIQATVRLVEIGVEPFFVAPSLLGILGQRLSRRICSHCIESYTPPPEELRYFQAETAPPGFVLYRGNGCIHCGGTGYSGRIGLHELVVVNRTIREQVAKGRPIAEIEAAAHAAGFRSMRSDGLKKAILGMTSLEEVLRVTVADEK